MLKNKSVKKEIKGLTKGELEAVLTTYGHQTVDLYSRNMVDYHLITDLLPAVSSAWKYQRSAFGVHDLEEILSGLGLQHKTIANPEKELELPSSQLLAMFNRTISKVAYSVLNSVLESSPLTVK
ncbi:N-acetyltransferase 10 [Desmophyllum pertusum]|uniref:N-acetyltransferase 10 n=1 Tax=Desmophyllum pertusum TaxID=174260 RepID=A0A9W9Z7C1_9CNID|nr:N-acetyltransferase 10 [Desmophyllum pertusum]